MHAKQVELNRRSLLGRAAALGGAAVLAPAAIAVSSPARAAAPLPAAPQAGALRRKLGSFEVTALLDGHIDVDTALVVGYDEKTASELKKAQFIDTAAIRIPVNAYLVNTGERLVLIDAGSSDKLGPTMGRLTSAVEAAGVAPEQVDAVVITHMHPDHIYGVLTPEGAPAFPNAELILPETDYAYWYDDAAMNAAPDAFKAFFVGARQAAEAYAKRQTRFSGESEILPGLKPLALPGHTPGHTGYVLDSGGETLFVVGDVVHVAALQFARPDWSMVFDVDAAAAAATRKRVLDQIATDRVMIAGMHLPFPGFGHVARDGDGYRFVPAEWAYGG